MKSIIKKALSATKESKHIEFKSSFNTDAAQYWCEIIKDIAALANSGGGVIIFGVDNNGVPTGYDVTPMLKLDPATITDKINSYTGTQFSDFDVTEVMKGSAKLVALEIGPTDVPIIFTKPGTYALSNSKQNTAFSRGTVYFRHGAKSELGISDDLRQVIDRRLEDIRKQWINGVQRVVEAPVGSQVTILPPEVRQSQSLEATPIRIVSDPSAPAYRIVDPNQTHIFRQVDVVEELRKRLPSSISINPYDIFAVRRMYSIDDQAKYFFRPKFGSPQYSAEFVEWLEGQCKESPDFFLETRKQLRRGHSV